MAIAKKALVWSLFAAGGTLTAFVFPALIALFGLIALGFVPSGLDFQSSLAFAASWPGKIILFVIVFLALWHVAHRLRVLVHDFGIRADGIAASVLYLLAALGTVLAAVFLWQA